MAKKVPFMEGVEPVEQFSLDDKATLIQLGLEKDVDPSRPPKIADRYVRYGNNKFAVVEMKRSTLHKAIDQLESTIERLIKVGRRVDYAIIVTQKLNASESRLYRKGKYNRLLNPFTNEPYRITFGSLSLEVLIFYDNEVDRMYEGMLKYLRDVE
jgi:hypothetical protein